MQVLQVIQGMSDRSAGPTYTVARLAQELQRQGVGVSIKTLHSDQALEREFGLTIDAHGASLERRLGVSPMLMREIARLAHQSVVIHGHGIWRLLNLFPLMVREQSQARVVCSPQGAMSAWSMRSKRLIKQPFWQFLQRPALAKVHCFHATSMGEYEDIRRLGFSAPVAVIPNGVDVPPLARPERDAKTLLFVGRLDPVKGIDVLLESWQSLCREFPEWDLKIAGPLCGAYASVLRTMAAQLGLERVTFVGEVVGDAKSSLYEAASLFALPSRSENFGMVVAEALVHEVPVVTTTATPWRELDIRGAGWCVAPDGASWTAGLRVAMSRSTEMRRQMGGAGRQWMKEQYSWQRVASQTADVYAWLLGQSAMPECVKPY